MFLLEIKFNDNSFIKVWCVIAELRGFFTNWGHSIDELIDLLYEKNI